MISHHIQRVRQELIVVLKLDLGEAQHALENAPDYTVEEHYLARFRRYLARIETDVFHVAALLLNEGEEGIVKWFDADKGFGFIRTYTAEDIFVHQKGIAGDGFRELTKGQRVRFHRREGKETAEAWNVTPTTTNATESS